MVFEIHFQGKCIRTPRLYRWVIWKGAKQTPNVLVAAWHWKLSRWRPLAIINLLRFRLNSLVFLLPVNVTPLTAIWYLCLKSHILDDHPNRLIGLLFVGRFRLNFNCYVIQVCVQYRTVTMVTKRSCCLHVLKCHSDCLCLESICWPCPCLIYFQ